MLNTVRRGPALARAFRACAPRGLQSATITSALVANVRTTLPLASYFAPQIRSFQSTVSLKQANAAATAQAQTQESSKPISEFKDLADQGLVHPRIIHAITEGMRINSMTDVQRLTIAHTIKGVDTLAQAKTGTGKTLAFLVPVLQKIITNDPTLLQGGRRAPRSHSGDIRAIIISPTRELAEQIAVEARKVASNTAIVVQSAVGGTRKQEGLARIKREGCHVLVATPGRLKDILSDRSSGVSAPNLDVFVLDEADRLLDDGFGPEIESIKELLPDPSLRDRQTLMFSATIPREVMGMVRMSMKPDFEKVNTVAQDEVPTHLRVPQKVVFLRGFENGVPAILEIIEKYKQRQQMDPSLRPLKAIIYYNTTTEVQLVYDAFTQMRTNPLDPRSGNPFGRHIFLMHSKLTQGQRTSFSNNFRHSRSGILISSDVTARGLDFPDVTHVIQMSVPKTRESYVHRLGRTGRANKEGEGWIIVHDEEDQLFIEKLGSLPIQQDETITCANVDMAQKDKLEGLPKAIIEQTTAAFQMVPYETKEDVYRAQISASGGHFRRKAVFIEALNNLAKNGWGLAQVPPVSQNYAAKLGFMGVPGLNISENRRSRFNDRSDRSDRSSYGSRGFSEERTSRFQRPSRDQPDWNRFSADRQSRIGFDVFSRGRGRGRDRQ